MPLFFSLDDSLLSGQFNVNNQAVIRRRDEAAGMMRPHAVPYSPGCILTERASVKSSSVPLTGSLDYEAALTSIDTKSPCWIVTAQIVSGARGRRPGDFK